YQSLLLSLALAEINFGSQYRSSTNIRTALPLAHKSSQISNRIAKHLHYLSECRSTSPQLSSETTDSRHIVGTPRTAKRKSTIGALRDVGLEETTIIDEAMFNQLTDMCSH